MATAPNTVTGTMPAYQASYQIVTTTSFTAAEVVAQTAVDNANTITVPGVRAAVAATSSMPAIPADEIIHIRPTTGKDGIVTVSARVTADNTVTVKFANVTAGNLTPTATTYVLTIMRQTTSKSTFDGGA